MIQLLRKLFDTSKRDVESVSPIVNHINELEPEFVALSDDLLKERARNFLGPGQKRREHGQLAARSLRGRP